MRRIELGLSQEQLADLISEDDQFLRQSDISRIESGQVEQPRLDRLKRLAVELDLPLGALLMCSRWAGQDVNPERTKPVASIPTGAPEADAIWHSYDA